MKNDKPVLHTREFFADTKGMAEEINKLGWAEYYLSHEQHDIGNGCVVCVALFRMPETEVIHGDE